MPGVRTLRWLVGGLVAAGLVVVGVVFWSGLRHWVAVHTGVTTLSGPSVWYNAWSGILSDLGEYTVPVGIVLGLRHLNCHEPRCPRMGHPLALPDGTSVRACHRHHPTHPRSRRARPLVELHRQHGGVPLLPPAEPGV